MKKYPVKRWDEKPDAPFFLGGNVRINGDRINGFFRLYAYKSGIPWGYNYNPLIPSALILTSCPGHPQVPLGSHEFTFWKPSRMSWGKISPNQPNPLGATN